MITPDGTKRRTDRTEAFSDAVLAVAITLPIVELKSPRALPGYSLARQYEALAPQYATYGLSFIVIGLYWGYSHFSGKLFRATDHVFNLLTLIFLAAVSVTPFSARPLIEHLHDPQNVRTAATVYVAALTAPAAAWTVRWIYGVRGGLLDPHLAPDYLRSVTRRYVVSACLCFAALLVTAFASWPLGLAIIAIVTLQFALPPVQPRYKAGEEPDDDVQEADERAPAAR